MVRLIGDHQRPRGRCALPPAGGLGDSRVGHRDPIKPPRRPRRGRVRRQLDPQPARRPRPLPSQRPGRASDHHRSRRPRGQLPSSELQRRTRLARPRRRREQERTPLPPIHRRKRARLPKPQSRRGLQIGLGHGPDIVTSHPDTTPPPPTRPRRNRRPAPEKQMCARQSRAAIPRNSDKATRDDRHERFGEMSPKRSRAVGQQHPESDRAASAEEKSHGMSVALEREGN